MAIVIVGLGNGALRRLVGKKVDAEQQLGSLTAAIGLGIEY